MNPAELLRSFGISPSPQRVAIYGLLRKHPAHQTAEDVHRAVRRELPTLSLATVYNTLRLLTEKGALRELIIEEGVLRYDANLRSHAHFKCVRCGEVFDLWPNPGEAVVPAIPGLPEDFSVEEIQLCCRGVCAGCR